MKVALGIPSQDMVHADFAFCLSRLVGFTVSESKHQIVSFINSKSSIVEKGRHEMIEKALKSPAEFILMLDSDMTFPDETLSILASHKKDIVGCDYSTRRPPLKRTARDLHGDFFKEGTKGLKMCSAIATGILLINLEVFRKIGVPYFTVDWDYEKNIFIGEDYLFCRNARELKYDIFCDLDLSKKIKHIGQTAWGIE